MKWNDVRLAAAQLSGERIERDVWSLSEDPRFPAIVALIEDARFTRLAQGSSVTAASDHGTLAHCMGAVDVIDELERRLQTMIEPPAEEKQP